MNESKLKSGIESIVDKGKEYWNKFGYAEIAGTVGLLLGYYAGDAGIGKITNNTLLTDVGAAYTAALGENLFFYTVIICKQIREDFLSAKSRDEKYETREILKSSGRLAADYGPAEIVDSFVTRPAAVLGGAALIENPMGVLLGKLTGDALFYSIVIPSYEIRRKVESKFQTKKSDKEDWMR